MDVSERHIVKVVKDLRVHIVGSAHRGLFRFRARRPRHKLVRHQHVPGRAVHAHLPDRRAHGIGVALDFLIREVAAHVGRLDERQHVDADRSVPILQHNRLHLPVIDRGQMHAAPVQKPGAERDSLRRVVVPADDEDLKILSCEIVQEVVKQLHGFGRRNGLVVNVARQDHRIRFLPVDDVQDFFQNIPLVFQHAEFVDPLSQMQV